MENNPKLVQVDQEKMAALKALADTNILVSDAHTALADIKGLEASYLVEREGKAAAAVDRILDESEETLRQARENYAAVATLASDTRAVSGRVTDLLGAVKGVMERFREKAAIWEKNVEDRERRLEEAKTSFAVQKKVLDNERKSLDERALELTDAERRLAADRDYVDKLTSKVKEVK